MSDETPKLNKYVIVRPGGWGHVSDNPHAHLVVHVDEWVKVHHGEQQTYSFASEHTTYDGAHNRCVELNGTGTLVVERPEGVETPIEVEGEGVQWLGEKAA